ncbi:Zn-ribbon domain-containing OB-fold protein [Streptomyces sp. NPDC004609]|uniref:Zn-ribbon domain-containing OB-fold protein n=1 Tax=Streptomyces sp. NPDC004609 TaxID=3364704 RepID=UPI0036A64C1E
MTRTPVVAGWFTHDGEEEDFRLLGTRCTACSSVFFPPEHSFCRNPACSSGELAEVALSRRGRVWSYTDGRYRPPAPYVSDPGTEWEPYTLVAVELAAERMVVLGQAAPGVSVADLAVGMEVEVVPGVLAGTEGAGESGGPGGNGEDSRSSGNDGAGGESAARWTTWHWRPVGADR